MKAALYIRVSTDDQAESGYSLEAQEAKLRQHCESAGHEVVGVYVDPGISGTVPFTDRPGGQQLMSDLARLKVQVVVAAKVDRVARSLLELLKIQQIWKERQVAMRVLDLAVDTTTPEGQMMLQFVGALGEVERNMIAQRTTTTLAHMKTRGLRTGGIPYGYKLVDSDPSRLEEHPTEAATIRVIRDLHASGMSIATITNHLQASGIAPRGSAWHKTTVHGILVGTRKPKQRRPKSGYVKVRPLDLEQVRALYSAGHSPTAISSATGQEESRILRVLDAIDDPGRLQEQQGEASLLKKKGWSYARIAEHWGVTVGHVRDVVDGNATIEARAWRARPARSVQ